MIDLPPAHRIEVAEQTAGVVVPTPPQVASQRPKPFLGGSDEAIQSAGLADRGRDLRRGLRQHANFIFVKNRGAMVCTTRTPCITPRSISGTPRNDW